MAENNAKNYEGGTKGLGSVKTDVVSPALQKLTELSVKLRALTDNILEIKAKKVREEEERRAEEERRKEAEELLRIQKEEAEKKKAIWSTLEAGTVVEGTVRRLTDFGAFVDIGGVDGLSKSRKRLRLPQRRKHPQRNPKRQRPNKSPSYKHAFSHKTTENLVRTVRRDKIVRKAQVSTIIIVRRDKTTRVRNSRRAVSRSPEWARRLRRLPQTQTTRALRGTPLRKRKQALSRTTKRLRTKSR